MKPGKKIVAMVAATLMSPSLFAAPTAYTNGATDKKVKNNTNSMVLWDTKDPKRIYVMPPLSGTGKVANVSPGANVGFCPEMADLQKYSREASKRLARFSASQSKELEKRLKRVGELETALEQANALLKTKEVSYYKELQQKEQNVERRIEDLLDRLDSDECLEGCPNLREEYKAQKQERKVIRTEMAKLRRDHRKILSRYRNAMGKVEAAQKHVDILDEAISKINANIIRTRSTFIDLYKDFAKFEGGFYEVNYSTGWDANMQKLRDENPNFNIEKIDTAEARIYAAITGAQEKFDYLNSLPMILDYTINGKGYVPYGPGQEAELPAYPDNPEMDLRLSLIGSCAFLHPDLFGIDKADPPTFGIGVTYKHPAVYKREVSVTFNLHKIYEIVKESGSGGGLFSRKSWSKVTEKNWSEETFSIKFENEDPNNPFTDEYKQKVTREIKAEMVARVLMEMGTPRAGGGAGPLPNMPLPPSGASVLADGLMKTCGYASIYCAAGSWVLRGLGAIFGSSKVEQSFYQEHNHTKTENWTYSEARLRPAATMLGL